MASFNLPTSQLTPKGRAKIKKIQAAIKTAATQILLAEAQEFVKRAAALAPSPTEEATLLSRGTVAVGTPKGKGSSSGDVVGTSRSGRFEKAGMLSVQDAILSSKPAIRKTKNGISVSIGSYKDMNAVTGFSWATRNRGMRGPTLPFNRHLLEALERGGLWVVTPQKSTPPHALEPQNNVFATVIVKTLQPRNMFRLATAETRQSLKGAKATLQAVVKSAAK